MPYPWDEIQGKVVFHMVVICFGRRITRAASDSAKLALPVSERQFVRNKVILAIVTHIFEMCVLCACAHLGREPEFGSQFENQEAVAAMGAAGPVTD